MEELYKRYSKMIYAFLLSLCGNQTLAEDLMQETFLQAYLSLGRYDGTCKESVWLCQIAKHLWYRHLAKHKKEQPTEDFSEFVSASPGPEQTAIARDDYARLMTGIKTLTEPSKTVVTLRLFGDLSFAEIGEILKKNENWARVTYYRAKEKLWKGMNENENNYL